MSKNYVLTGLAAVTALALACGGGDKAPNPVSPSAGDSALGGDAGSEGQTLKVPGPTLVAPGNGAALEVFDPTLQLNAVTPLFAGSAAFAYRFQILSGSTVVAEHRTGATSWRVEANLNNNTTYGWRARAEQGTFFGPWSATWTFRTPDQPEGYIRGNEVYDPLYNGRSIGAVVGGHQFIPNVGVRLDGLTSHVRYQLQQTLAGGEFSMLVTGVADNTDGGKTKLMSMSEGLADITTNDRRFTFERRGDPFGVMAWRMITSNDQIDTIGAERRYVRFSHDQTYLVRTVWGGNVLTLSVLEGGAGGRSIYQFSKPYRGVYDPNPHMAFIGSPVGRGGPGDATIPGLTARQVWISSRPRPAFANK